MSTYDDSVMYTGVDNAPNGMFGNESKPENIEQLLQEEQRKVKEIAPQLEQILSMIDEEKKTIIDYITGYVDNSKESDDLYRAELKAAAMYRKYLDGLKTKYTLILNESKRNGK